MRGLITVRLCPLTAGAPCPPCRHAWSAQSRDAVLAKATEQMFEKWGTYIKGEVQVRTLGPRPGRARGHARPPARVDGEQRAASAMACWWTRERESMRVVLGAGAPEPRLTCSGCAGERRGPRAARKAAHGDGRQVQRAHRHRQRAKRRRGWPQRQAQGVCVRTSGQPNSSRICETMRLATAVCPRVCVRACVRACVTPRVAVADAGLCMYVCMYMFVCLYVCVSLYVCVYIYVYAYIHIYT